MANIYSVNVSNEEGKKISIKEKVKNFAIKVENWYYNNKEFAMVIIPAVGGLGLATIKGGVYFGKKAIKERQLKKEEAIKNLYCYDRSLGHYWKLRRELTNTEWTEIDRRKRNGERLADILDDFKVLK